MPPIPQNLLFELFLQLLKDPAIAFVYLVLVLAFGVLLILLVCLCQFIKTCVRIKRAKMWLDFHKLASEHKDRKVRNLAQSLIRHDLIPKPRDQGAFDGFLALFSGKRKP